MATQLPVVLDTTSILLDQFSTSLSSNENGTSSHHQEPTSNTNGSPNQQSALPLLRIGSTTMKAVVTKLSLLTITTPFTASAVATMLRQLNDSILPSLVSGALSLGSSPQSTNLFAKEARFLVRRAMEDLKPLIKSIRLQMTSNSQHPVEISSADKKAVLDATGKIFEDCDAIQRFAEGGLKIFIVKKAESWLELMRDAVKELEEWDPEEDEDEDLLGAFSGLTVTNGVPSSHDSPSTNADTNSTNTAIQSGVKSELLRVLTRIPRTIRAVITHRLLKLPSDLTSPSPSLLPAHVQTLSTIIDLTRAISECIDESAEAMYMGDGERALRKAGEARQLCIEVVEGFVEEGWDGDGDRGGNTREDRYMAKALAYIRQVHSAEAAGST